MAIYPIKVLLDRNRQPFIPFTTTSSIVENGTNRRLDKILGNLDDLQTNNKNSLVSAINEILVGSGSGAGINIQIVDELPTENISLTTIYFKHMATSKPHNVYEEWMYINDAWELIGTTEMDLSGYATTTMVGDLSTLKTTDKDSVVDAVNELVDKQLVAGNGITLDGNTINLSGSTIKTLTGDTINRDDLEPGNIYYCPNMAHFGFGNGSSNSNALKGTLLYVDKHPSFGKRVTYIENHSTINVATNGSLYSFTLSNFVQKNNVLTKTNTTSYTPTANYHPATKKYVDDKVAEGSGSGVDLSNYLAKDNTTEFTPTADYNPSTKKYVDDKFSSVPLIDSYTKTEVDTKLANYLAKDNLTEYTPTSDYHPATKKFVESVVASIDMSKSNITFWCLSWNESPYAVPPSHVIKLVGYDSGTGPTIYSHVPTNKYTATPVSNGYMAAFKFTEPVTLKNVITVKTKTKINPRIHQYMAYATGEPGGHLNLIPKYKNVYYSAPDDEGFFDTIMTCYYDIKDKQLNKLIELEDCVNLDPSSTDTTNIVCKKIESSWEIL